MKTLASENLKRHLQKAREQFQTCLDRTEDLELFDVIVGKIAESLENGGRLFIAGNGGSASDSLHIAGELVCKLGRSRRALAAESLAADVATLTAIANDFGYDQVFSRQLEGKASSKDVFLALTTSGKSPNIIRALQSCRAMGVLTIALTGFQGGAARELADHCWIAPGDSSSEIQQVHQVFYHCLCEALEDRLAP